MRPQHDDSAREADWPYASLLIFGYFGSGSPGGRRFARRNALALIVILLSTILLAPGFEQPAIRFAGAVGVPVGVAIMGLAFFRYLRGLDELSRQMQLMGFAFSYGMVLLLVSAAASFTTAVDHMIWIPPMLLFFFLLFLAEAIRGLALFVLARKYR